MIQVTLPIAVTLLLGFLGLLLGFGRALLAQFEKRMDERMVAQNVLREEQLSRVAGELAGVGREVAAERARVSAVQEQVNLLCARLPLEYLRREDWIRFSATFDRQFEKIFEGIGRLSEAFARNSRGDET